MAADFKKWENFLDPEALKSNLISISLFVAIYESFTDYVIEEVKFFFHTGWDETGHKFSSNYKLKVLSLDKNVLNATLKWLESIGTIDQSDILAIQEVRKYRNLLTHEMMSQIVNGLESSYHLHFEQLINIRIKIERWWIINVEIPTGDDPSEIIDENQIFTGSQMILRLITDMLSKDETTANYYKNEFKKRNPEN